MANKIIDAFQRFKALIGQEDFSISPTPNPIFPSDLLDQAIDFHCVKIRKLAGERGEFFAQFDYSWAFEVSSFTSVLEVQLQYFLLRVISEISPTHPEYGNLGNLCVRLLPSQFVNAEAARYDGYKFILISTSLLKIMQAWGIMLPRLASIGRQFSDTGEIICANNDFLGRDVEKAVRYDWANCIAPLDMFLDRIASYTTGIIPTDSFRIADFLFDGESSELTLAGAQAEIASRVGGLLLSAEMFFVCHEVVHLIKHEVQSATRNDREELEADHGAGSLMVIFQSTAFRFFLECVEDSSLYGRYYASLLTSKELGSALFVGPAVFFSTLHATLTIEMALSVPEHSAATRAEFDLIRRRTAAYEGTVSSYGLDMISMLVLLKEGDQNSGKSRDRLVFTYPSALQQFDVMFVALRMRLLEQAGMPFEKVRAYVNLERNLFRGFDPSRGLDIRDLIVANLNSDL